MNRVDDFVNAHGLRHIFDESSAAIADVFGPTAVECEIVADPDDGGHEQLWVLIPWAGNVEEGRNLMRKFDDEWWLDRIAQTKCRLGFDLKFEPHGQEGANANEKAR